MITDQQKKATGSFYTCKSISDFIARWAIAVGNEVVLEPSFGDGQFILSALEAYRDLGNHRPTVYGVELQDEPYSLFMTAHPQIHGYLGDFMEFTPMTPVDAVIGNPPYISLRNLSSKQREHIQALMKEYAIELPMTASVWMPFVIHSCEQLNVGGRLGFVLPYEITYVRYAFRLWEYLRTQFGKISILRVYRDFFPDVDVETVILLAENKGQTTNVVHYEIFDSIERLMQNEPRQHTSFDIEEIISMKKPFETHLLEDSVRTMLQAMEEKKLLRPTVSDCKFKIGYVTGNNRFFHPTKQTVDQYGIPQTSLIPCIEKSKRANHCPKLTLCTSSLETESVLFYPPDRPGAPERAYIEYGESLGIHKAYKCKTRTPWYVTPFLEIPDVILTVFGDIPRFIVNDGRFAVSNSFLAGFVKGNASAKEIACRWYNSLTLLMLEIYIHSLGGGSFVLIPGEVDMIPILSDFPSKQVEPIFASLNQTALSDGIEAAYRLGDTLVLKEIYHLTDGEIEQIQNACQTLRSWRCPKERRE